MYDLINWSRSNEPFAASPCGRLCPDAGWQGWPRRALTLCQRAHGLGPGGFGRPVASPRALGEHASGNHYLAGLHPCLLLIHGRSAGTAMVKLWRPSVLSGCILRLRQRHATCQPQPVRFPWDGRPPRKNTSRPGHRSPHAQGPSRCDST